MFSTAGYLLSTSKGLPDDDLYWSERLVKDMKNQYVYFVGILISKSTSVTLLLLLLVVVVVVVVVVVLVLLLLLLLLTKS